MLPDLQDRAPSAGVAPDLPGADQLGPDGLLDVALEDLRRRWQLGERGLAAAYSERYPALRTPEAVAALLYLEFVLRSEAGEDASFDGYLGQFPQYAVPLRRLRQADELLGKALFPPAAPALHGRRVGDYELLEEIGRGGMGVVYRARQVSLGRIVAVKMILGGALGPAADGRRLRNEAEAAARLQHPGIVAIHEVGEWEGQPFFSMDYVEGTTLAALIREHPLPAARASGYVEAIARAVHHAHESGVLHRDLKPSNVLIGADDQPRVTDFGLARQVQADQRLTGTGELLGTPSYIPPEQASDKYGAAGPASDVYALGAVLYELLTGRPPFQAETAIDTLLLVLHNEPVSPRRLNPRVPRDLETVCLKCLRKDPGQRYPTAAALAEDLGRFQRGEPVRARPVGAAARAWRWCRRNRAVAALLAGLFLVLTAGLVVSLSEWRRANQEAAQAQQDRDTAKAERERAEGNLDMADEAVERMLRHLGNERLADVPQATPVRRELLLEARQLYQSLLLQKSADPKMRVRLGTIHGQLGNAQASLGQTEDALASMDSAAQIFRALSAEYPDQLDYLRQLAASYRARGAVLAKSRAVAEIKQAYEAAERILDRLVSDPGAEPRDRYALATFHVDQCEWLYFRVLFKEGEDHARKSLGLLKPLLEESPGDWNYRRAAAAAHNALAVALKRTGREPEAKAHYEECLRLREDLLSGSPQSPLLRAELATCHRNLALLVRDSGRTDEARKHYQEARRSFEGLAADFPDVLMYHAELAEIYNGLAKCALPEGKGAEARDYLRLAVEQQRVTLPSDPQHRFNRDKMFHRLIQLADVQFRLGAYQEAAAAAYESRLFITQPRACADAAGLLAACIDAAENDERLPPSERKALAARYAGQAVEVLRAGAAAHFVNAAFLKETNLKQLAVYPEYRKFSAELGADGG
jgi:tetratricopeptide (TPR) repeat protein